VRLSRRRLADANAAQRSSYLSSSELILTFGLAQRDKADAIEIRWPSGQVDHLSNVQQAKPSRRQKAKDKPRPALTRNSLAIQLLLAEPAARVLWTGSNESPA